MFKPHPMKKILIVGSKDRIDSTIDVLFELRCLHLTDFKDQDDDFSIGTPLAQAAPSSEKLLKLRGAAKVLDITSESVEPFTKPDKRLDVDQVEKDLNRTIDKVDKEIMGKWEERNQIENQARDIERKIEDLGPYENLPLKLEDLRPYKNLAMFLGIVRGDPEKAIEDTTRDFEIFMTATREGQLMALFIDKRHKEEVARTLVSFGYSEVRPPEGTGFVKGHIANLTVEKDELERDLLKVDEELAALSKRSAQLLLASEEHLRIEVEKSEVPMRFATSANSFVIEGFVPEIGATRLKKALAEATDDRVYVEILDPELDEDIPVQMKNPKAARPFEVLTDLVARPKYEEVDPSFLMFIFMPIFFGIMLGDVGYAITILICLKLGVFTKMFNFLGMKGAAPQLNAILMLCAIWSLVWGFVYNECYGIELFAHSRLHHGVVVIFPMIHLPEIIIPRILVWGPTYLPVIRFENVLPLLKFTIWIGLFHIFLGLCVGFRNKYVTHGFKHALFDKGSWLIIIIGGVITFYFMLRDIGGFVHLSYHDTASYTGFAILIVGCLLLIKGEGIIGLVHLPSIISNTMSYARILAIGLSSAGIALAFNNMSFGLFEAGGATFAFGCFVFGFGHFINILLGLVGPGLHSLRLHYVEFFVKFYEGGGTSYSPFGLVRRFTTT